MTYISVRAPAPWGADRVALPDGARIVASDVAGEEYTLIECPDADTEAFALGLREHATTVTFADTVDALVEALGRLGAPLGECDLAQSVQFAGGTDFYTGIVRRTEALRDRLRVLGEPEAALLDELLDLVRTHALPEEHPLANR